MSKKSHDEHTRIISLKPHLINLEDIALTTAEANLFDEKRLIRQPDNLAFDYHSKTIWNMEYKCSGKQENHAIHQLRDSKQYLQLIFKDWNIVNLYIHENYKVEEIK